MKEMKNKKHYVIVGNSAAGLAAARSIRLIDAQGKILVLTDEEGPAYSKIMLPLFIGGQVSREEMVLAPESFYRENAIELKTRAKVQGIDISHCSLSLENGEKVPYDELLLATGASPYLPPIEGIHMPGVYPLRTREDAERISAALSCIQGEAVVYGGGLVGLKCLEALFNRVGRVRLIVSSDQILSMMLDRTAAAIFQTRLEANGIKVHLQTELVACRGKGSLEKVVLANGQEIPCGLMIVAKGVVSNMQMIAGTSLRAEEGILVDKRMATGNPHIYAAGDVCQPDDLLGGGKRQFPLWPLAVEEGRVAGANMAGVSQVFSGGIRMNAVELFGLKVISMGITETQPGPLVTSQSRQDGAGYRKIIFSGSRLKGCIMLGDINGGGVVESFIRSQQEVDEFFIRKVVAGSVSYAHRLWPRGGRK